MTDWKLESGRQNLVNRRLWLWHETQTCSFDAFRYMLLELLSGSWQVRQEKVCDW